MVVVVEVVVVVVVVVMEMVVVVEVVVLVDVIAGATAFISTSVQPPGHPGITPTSSWCSAQ